MGFVRLNEKAVYNAVALKDKDIIEMGNSKFMYIKYDLTSSE